MGSNYGYRWVIAYYPNAELCYLPGATVQQAVWRRRSILLLADESIFAPKPERYSCVGTLGAYLVVILLCQSPPCLSRSSKCQAISLLMILGAKLELAKCAPFDNAYWVHTTVLHVTGFIIKATFRNTLQQYTFCKQAKKMQLAKY